MQEPNATVALCKPAQQGEGVSTTAAIALLLLGGVLLAPVTLTAVGARRRGQPWQIALVSAVLFPVAWTLWYVADEHPFSRRPPVPR